MTSSAWHFASPLSRACPLASTQAAQAVFASGTVAFRALPAHCYRASSAGSCSSTASVCVATCWGVGTTFTSGRTPRPNCGCGQAVSIWKCGNCSTKCVWGSSKSEMLPPLQPASPPPVSSPTTMIRRWARRLAARKPPKTCRHRPALPPYPENNGPGKAAARLRCYW